MTDTRSWSGTVAFLNTPTVDGRVLKMSTLPTGKLPLALYAPGGSSYGLWWREATRPIGMNGLGWVGGVYETEIHGDEVRAAGFIRLDFVAEVLRERLLAGESVGVAIDVDGITTNESTGSAPPAFTQATLRRLTISDNPAWTASRITLVPEALS